MSETPTKVSSEYDGKQRTLFRIECEVCGKECWVPKHVLGVKRFCSKACMNQSHRVAVECAFCKKSFTKPVGRLGRGSKSGLQFCSRECKDAAQRIDSGFDVLHPPHYKTGAREYRAKAFRELPHACNRCGWDKYPEVLQVHHKDRDRNNANRENLEILCPTCHEVEHLLTESGRYTTRGA